MTGRCISDPSYVKFSQNKLFSTYHHPPDAEFIPSGLQISRNPCPKRDEENQFTKQLVMIGVSIIDVLAQNVLSQPFIITQRQCQINHKALKYHLLPVTLIPVMYSVYQQQGLLSLFKGIKSKLLVHGMTNFVEDLISRITAYPKEIALNSSLKQIYQSVFLKLFSALLITPFYSLSLTESVQSNIASDPPTVFQFFVESIKRMSLKCNDRQNFKISLWLLVIPTVTLKVTRYLFSTSIKEITNRLLNMRSVGNMKNNCHENDHCESAMFRCNEMHARLISNILTDVIFYPCETILMRMHLQGTRILFDNLENGKSVLPLLTKYAGLIDCYEDILVKEGFSGFYRGFGALILQYAFHVILLRCSHILFRKCVVIFHKSLYSAQTIERNSLRNNYLTINS